ncbi:hypothetical protein CK203_040589 [Vitis vinifera]|uniref:Retrovirus-related Pol polyprotein from transposon TNT 1-94 n=1 Tax=Vitis vinifera TaxID=29760 RepID=A0A438HI15_VITVI|nr:hypothetical protein CK203_040589 [Vitis vinifera]
MAFQGINQATSNPGITLQLSTIKPLTGNNFEEWYESFNVHMTLQNLDLALRVDESSKPTDVSSTDERFFYERWEHSNRSCLMRSHHQAKALLQQANEMKVELNDKFLKWLILESLPTSFDAVKLTYNALKEEWTLEELMSIVVQHEVSLKKNETHSLALVTDQVSI